MGDHRGGHRWAAAVAAVLLLLPTVALAVTGDDPRRSQLWWFDVLGIEEAWATSTGEDVVIAVVDTGARLDHPDLVGQFAVDDDGGIGTDLVDRDRMPDDDNGHGTLVAGLAAAAAGNGEGVAGVAPGARILPVRVLDAGGRGRASTVEAGIRWAVDNGADVINLSLEVEERATSPEAVLTAPSSAIEYAWERGVVVVAATGNSGGGAAGYPEGSPVLLVGATDREDAAASFSDDGRRDGVMAPGTDMVSTWCQPAGDGCDPATPYGIGTGTSFAAPVVSGVLALLLATGLDAEQAVRVLRETAVDLGDPGPDDRFGVGRIDAAAAVAAAVSVRAGGEPAAGPSPPAPTAAPSPAPTPTATAPLVPRPDGPVVDVPGSASPAPAPGDEVADAPRGEPDERQPALVLTAVLLLLVTVSAVARLAALGRRDPR